jgi:hypothetical protein
VGDRLDRKISTSLPSRRASPASVSHELELPLRIEIRIGHAP